MVLISLFFYRGPINITVATFVCARTLVGVQQCRIERTPTLDVNQIPNNNATNNNNETLFLIFKVGINEAC